ncbi:hypothetical protein LTR70_010120 [Exophiala xenobiotica]|uniref:CENP-V/GFA domain-containing protein n=1 Tax=Lithohypha guttulata TaxID=1690604 RepID=A0ABR0JV40_9EURO|nr:hypothetical protein LTR24_010069 [Lithohypha guttulata]KAK5309638.1 hypothetical protein LTR70_010120 [Exophiala xenobiotica]
MPQGSCLCGKLTYSYDDAVMKCICHCLTCRKLTGSTYATALLMPEDSLKTNANPPLVTNAAHQVGMKMQFHGCDSCPSTLYKTAAGFPGVKIVFAGTLDGKDDIATEGKPGGELWVKYRVPWLKPLEGCQQFEEFPPPN